MTTPTHHWIYALPGTHLQGFRSAGAPSLDTLQSMVHESGDWRAWILYGPPDQALQELCREQEPSPRAEVIDEWEEQLTAAARVKRQWRDRVVVINLEGNATATVQPAALQVLQDALPELELQARLSRRPTTSQLSDAFARMAALCLIQADPGLLQAYLDLEHWADSPSSAAQQNLWRGTLSPDLILEALGCANRFEREAELDRIKIRELRRDCERCYQERGLVNHTIEQLEAELEHYVAEHLSLKAITSKLENQLLRARRLLTSPLQP